MAAAAPGAGPLAGRLFLGPRPRYRFARPDDSIPGGKMGTAMADDRLTAITAQNWASFKKVMTTATLGVIVVVGLMAIFLL
jgi:hypothetical protein